MLTYGNINITNYIYTKLAGISSRKKQKILDVPTITNPTEKLEKHNP